MTHAAPSPENFWPPGFMPTGFSPPLSGAGAGGTYLVYSQPTPDVDAVKTLVAEVEAGTTQYLFEGDADSVQWLFVRVVSACGVADGEPVRPKLRRVAFDSEGNLIPDVPKAPHGLHCVVGAAGLVTARWAYDPTGQMAAPATFNVYTTSGATPFDFDTPAGSVAYTPGQRDLSYGATFDHGVTAKFVVRAVTSIGKASGGEEPNTTEASAIADAQAPDAPEDLYVVQVG